MGDTVLVHDLGTTKLQVGSVHFATQQLVDGRSTSEDDWLALDLDGTLSETDEVRTDTDGTAGDERDGEDVLVCARGLTGDETGTLQTLDTETVFSTNNGGDDVADLAVHFNLFGNDSLECAILEA